MGSKLCWSNQDLGNRRNTETSISYRGSELIVIPCKENNCGQTIIMSQNSNSESFAKHNCYYQEKPAENYSIRQMSNKFSSTILKSENSTSYEKKKLLITADTRASHTKRLFSSINSENNM
ncbi:unnamed protein product [Moneuplotes crassus]|uniref:Uncharacterized protein n=1 Tax=Euplotes crassus TaxID=5936 RepID=A0AAD1UJZ7_EUPCR|nr:unnamed protein product [Moneuplotes crassus]CAI2369302.1 unnamed protein product [Moneuplotes crassus]